MYDIPHVTYIDYELLFATSPIHTWKITLKIVDNKLSCELCFMSGVNGKCRISKCMTIYYIRGD